jgi:hypothetical protein
MTATTNEQVGEEDEEEEEEGSSRAFDLINCFQFVQVAAQRGGWEEPKTREKGRGGERREAVCAVKYEVGTGLCYTQTRTTKIRRA